MASSHEMSTDLEQLRPVLEAGRLAGRLEPFDTFSKAPADISKGYGRFEALYRHNYLPYLPSDLKARILVVSCGPGYLVNTLVKQGYQSVVGIDSAARMVRYARARGLDCRLERAFPFVAARRQAFEVVFCEQELNHLTVDEMMVFLDLVRESLVPGGTLIVHGVNGANPLTAPEALAQCGIHFNAFTAFSLRHVLTYAGFEQIRVFPLHLYVFYRNPFNYVAWGAAALLNGLFRLGFMLYGKDNRLFSKQIAACCRRPLQEGQPDRTPAREKA